MRFIREEEYRQVRSLVGKPVISPLGRLWLTQLSPILAVLWGITVTLRAVWLGSAEATVGAIAWWWGRLLVTAIFVVPVTCFLHELLHHLAAPGGLRSDRNVMLLKWGWLPVAAAHEAWVSRNRQLLIHLTPFIATTILSVVLAWLVAPAYRFYVALFWELNLLLCAADLVVAYRIVQLEPRAQVCGANVREPGTGSTA